VGKVREKRECRCGVREDRRVGIKKMRLAQDLALSDTLVEDAPIIKFHVEISHWLMV
jgi:hypothetical protein